MMRRAMSLYWATRDGNLGTVSQLLDSHGPRVLWEWQLSIRAREQEAEMKKDLLIQHRVQTQTNISKTDAIMFPGAAGVQPWDYETSPVLLAVQKGHVSIVKLMCEKAGGIVQEQLKGRDEEGNTGFLLAARHWGVDMLEVLYKTGGHQQLYKNKNGDTAMHFAAHRNHTPMVKRLLDWGGEELLHSENRNCRTPFYLATVHDRKNVIRVMTDKASFRQLLDTRATVAASSSGCSGGAQRYRQAFVGLRGYPPCGVVSYGGA